MARAASLAKASKVNRAKAGKPAAGGVRLGYTPPEFVGPPPGTYDPGLYAQVRSSERGLLDLIEQTHREGKREDQDTAQAIRLLKRKVSQGRADLARSKGYARQDVGDAREQLQTSFGRDLEDLAQAKQRGQEDYDRTLADLQHRYASAAAAQQEGEIKQGTLEHGTTDASAAVRSANQGWDKSGIDLQRSRQLADLAEAEGRERQDFDTNSEHLDQQFARQMTGYDVAGRRLGLEQGTQFKALNLAALRADQDRGIKISHGKREQAIYGTDVAQQAFYQAHQLNPKIIFPTPAAAAGVGPAPHRARQPGIGTGGIAPSTPHVRSPVARGVGLGPGVSRPRRPYTRFS